MSCVFFFQAEDGIRDLVRSRGLGDVYKRQGQILASDNCSTGNVSFVESNNGGSGCGSDPLIITRIYTCLLYTSDAADERSSVDLGGRRIIKKKKTERSRGRRAVNVM